MCKKLVFQQILHAHLYFLKTSTLTIGEIPVIFFLYIYHIKCDISKFPKNLLRPDGQTLEFFLTSVKLSSFHISFRWDRPRTSQEIKVSSGTVVITHLFVKKYKLKKLS